jgi:hypothetical protein
VSRTAPLEPAKRNLNDPGQVLVQTCKANKLTSLISENEGKNLNVGAVVPYLKKQAISDKTVESYCVVSSGMFPKFVIQMYQTYEQLVQINNELNVQGFGLKNCDANPIPKLSGSGVALWHFDTDIELKIQQEAKNFKGIIATDSSSEIRTV